MTQAIRNELKALGISDLESRIYLVLYQNPGLTGYRISRLLNKPISNTYKALSSLEKKGLAVSDGSHKARKYHALSIGEYLDRLERTFTDRRHKIEDELRHLSPSDEKEGLFRLTDYDQVIEKARHLIHGAQRVLMADIFPPLISELQEDLEEIASRGIAVFLLTYDDTAIPGCHHFRPYPGDTPLERWKADWLDICIDLSEFLLSVLFHEERTVLQAIWGRNLHLGASVTTQLGTEMQLRKMMQAIYEEHDHSTLKGIYNSLFNQLFHDTGLITKYQEYVRR